MKEYNMGLVNYKQTHAYAEDIPQIQDKSLVRLNGFFCKAERI